MNIGSFKTYVKYDLKRTDKDTEIVQALNDAIVAVAVKIPHSAYKYQSYIATVAGQEDYALPSTIIHLMHPIRLIEGSGTNDTGWELDHLTKEEYDALEPNPNRTSPDDGSPISYCIFSNSILLDPIPDDVYYIEINWSKRPTSISGDSESPSLGAEWDEVLKYMVLSRVCAGLGIYDSAQYWRSMYEDGEGNPVGMYRDLLKIEEDKEGIGIRQIQNNSL